MERPVILAPIKGFRLLVAVDEMNLFQILFPKYVSESVNVAIGRLVSEFGIKPEISGENITGIQQIREILFAACGGYPLINFFTIVAPHTHWEDRAPVVYSYDETEREYNIGVKAVLKSETYHPVSFVFTDQGLLPYEWCDLSIKIDSGEWAKAVETLILIADEVAKLNFPLGISIDFRYKESLIEPIISTTEFTKLIKGIEVTKIVKSEDLANYPVNDVFEQVAWHPVSDETMGLSKEEYDLLQYLKTNDIDITEHL